jgi:hypothetical protein
MSGPVGVKGMHQCSGEILRKGTADAFDHIGDGRCLASRNVEAGERKLQSVPRTISQIKWPHAFSSHDFMFQRKIPNQDHPVIILDRFSWSHACFEPIFGI